MRTDLPKLYEQLQQAGGGLTDGQLLGRFVAARDEASFAALVRRHGPMILGVCRRVLRDAHDAEDAFQATFLVLARKAASVAKRESVGCWLYAVAYHTALEAGRRNARRRAREKQVRDMPEPGIEPAEAPDWLPLLDRELNRLSEKYRAAVVLCDLEGHSRRDAARELGVPEGTLSSRLAKARKLLAKRLVGSGLVLSAAALAAVGARAASAQVPAALAGATARAAALVAAGQLAAAPTPAVVLMKGVMKVMLVKKLRLLVGAVMVAAAFGAVGFVCRPGDEARAQQFTAPEKERGDGKHSSELEALRKENELLKFNLHVLLEKAAAQEKELEALRGRKGPAGGPATVPTGPSTGTSPMRPGPGSPKDAPMPGGIKTPGSSRPPPGDANSLPGSGASSGDTAPSSIGFPQGTNSKGATTGYGVPGSVANNVTSVKPGETSAVPGAAQDLDSALKALQDARDKQELQRALDTLEKAIKKLRGKLKDGNSAR
jgi:RNA polymerase sigma factor (sigma-70 family)